MDEETMCKIEILKQVIGQMMRYNTIKGFRAWKDATIAQKDQEIVNKQRGSQIVIAKMKLMFFKS